jgi:CheY-like chemotaxis protein
VALTGYGQASDRERSQAAGFSAHLVKPVELVVIEKLLASLDI